VADNRFHLNLIKMEVMLSHPSPAIVSLAISSSSSFSRISLFSNLLAI